MSDMIVGIDLGTTNSEIAVYRDGRPVVQADEAGRLILPSVVGLDQDGGLLVGEPARNQYILHPERTVRSIKRRMGGDGKVSLGGREYAPQDISAMILRRLKEIAEKRLGLPVLKAVITVPAFFSDAQRQATREAGEIAGLEVVRIVNEPTAAALVYEAAQQQGKRVLVYDLGGGTFDVSVVRIEDGVVEVIASHGNNHLGRRRLRPQDRRARARPPEDRAQGGRQRRSAGDGPHSSRGRERQEGSFRSPLCPDRGGIPRRDRRRAGPSRAGALPRRL